MAIQCSCECDYCSLEFDIRKKVKARKAHVCCECIDKIHPGEAYFVHAIKWDGEFSSFKICRHCEQIGKNFGCHYCEGLFDGIYNWAIDADGDLPAELFDDLEPEGVAKLERLVLMRLEGEEAA